MARKVISAPRMGAAPMWAAMGGYVRLAPTMPRFRPLPGIVPRDNTCPRRPDTITGDAMPEWAAGSSRDAAKRL
jgi:hypothetical protein